MPLGRLPELPSIPVLVPNNVVKPRYESRSDYPIATNRSRERAMRGGPASLDILMKRSLLVKNLTKRHLLRTLNDYLGHW